MKRSVWMWEMEFTWNTYYEKTDKQPQQLQHINLRLTKQREPVMEKNQNGNNNNNAVIYANNGNNIININILM